MRANGKITVFCALIIGSLRRELNKMLLNLTLSPILRVQSVINSFSNVIFNKKEVNYTSLRYFCTKLYIMFQFVNFFPLFLQICYIISCLLANASYVTALCNLHYYVADINSTVNGRVPLDSVYFSMCQSLICSQQFVGTVFAVENL
jgi:hypothetical protein